MKEFLRCLLLPVGQETFVLPYSAVAEIIEIDLKDYTDLKAGQVIWRGIELPLVDLEAMISARNKEPVSTKREIAILNRFAETSTDFIGLILSDVPRMHRYKRSDVEYIGLSKRPYGLMDVKVRAEMAMIPKLEALQALIR